MLRREQDQWSPVARPAGLGTSPGRRDLLWIVLVSVAVVTGMVRWGLSAPLIDGVDSIDPRIVDGILALSVVVPLGAIVWLIRRHHRAVRADETMTRLPHHDPLTGLPDRDLLYTTLPEVLSSTKQHATRATVLFVDLDGFKTVNDTYGHEVGDRLMTAVGARLSDQLGAGRFVARHSGDEFVVLDPGAHTAEQGTRLARHLVGSIEAPFDLGEDRIGISAHVGVAFGTADDDAEVLVRDAATALELARTSPDRVAVFEPAMRSRLTSRNAERRLEAALQRGQFRLFYQPLVSLQDRAILGVEALLRWADPARGFVGASEFMPALEETGLIVPIGRWILHEACRQARHWAEIIPTGRRPIRVSVNISPRQLSQSDFVEVIRESIDTTGVEPTQIHLELNEAALVTNPRLTWVTLGAARELGVGLVLDDFGTGYSAISHLRDFDFELVKLDPSLVLGVGTTPENDVVVRHIIALARSLGTVAVAEGVAELAQAERLVELGCELGQGRYFADALPSQLIGQLITRDASRLSSAPPLSGSAPDPRDSGTVVGAARRSRDTGSHTDA